MNVSDKRPELLAPAGGPEAFRAALHWGADAVYLGLKNPFNARTKADNFAIEDLPEIIARAHSRNVKIYIAFNTLIRQSEFERAAAEALAAYRTGADALIVQDFGLAAELLKRDPHIVLHASTQAGIHNVEGALYAKDCGFRRVILSRETPLSEIRRIKEKTGMETEVFVHGALCVSFSGACYFSSVVSGNSGNRGKCLQFCRKQYSGQWSVAGGQLNDNAQCAMHNAQLKDGNSGRLTADGRQLKAQSAEKFPSAGGVAAKRTGWPANENKTDSRQPNHRPAANGYLLSPADLCLLNELSALRDAGVDCFKIEGRMRRPEYVAETVRTYRRALDGVRDPDALNRLKTVYNRGDFTTGYLYGVQPDFLSKDIQGHKGLYVGEVLRVNGRFLDVKPAARCESGVGAADGRPNKSGRKGVAAVFEDGNAFKLLRGGQEVGSALYEKGRLVYSGKPRPGDKLHITTSARQNKELFTIQ
ncbi:hypothetical protein FACS1894211_03010 [Clostridia bacterium]|nr:hypothetical protein FACS1894211_03010 [Clostridia bacterium]